MNKTYEDCVYAAAAADDDDGDLSTFVFDKSQSNATQSSSIASTNTGTNDTPWYSVTTSYSEANGSFTKSDIAYLVIGLLGITGNLFAIAVMVHHKPLRRRLATWFLINKSAQDLLTGVFLVLVNTVGTSEHLSGPIYEIYCRLWASKAIFLGFFISSLFSLVALTFEKYLEIAHPIKHRVQMTKTKVLWTIAILTSLAMGFKITYVASVSMVVDGNCVTFQYPDFASQVFTTTLNFLVEYLVPLMVIAYSYIGMAIALRKTVNPLKDISPRMIRARNNVIKTLLMVILAFVICVTYKEVLLLLQFYDLYRVDFDSWMFVVSQAMSFLSCCVDPFIYILNYVEFRRGAKVLLRKALTCGKKLPNAAKHDNELNTKTLETY